MAAVKPRAYRSELRAAQARGDPSPHSRVGACALRDAGLRDDDVVAIAAAAEVSVDTVYAVFGSKKALLKEIVDIGAGGDDEDVAVLERPDPQAMRTETDQRRQVTMLAAGITEQLERLRPIDDILLGAASVDEAAAELRADVQLRQRREAMRTVAGWIADRGPLRDEISAEDAGSILWTLASPEVHRMLRETCEWPRERYQPGCATHSPARFCPTEEQVDTANRAPLTIRAFEPSDEHAVVAYRNDPEVSRFQGWRLPFTTEDFAALAESGPVETGTWRSRCICDSTWARGDIGLRMLDGKPS